MPEGQSQKLITKTVIKPARTTLKEPLKVILEKADVDYIRLFSGGHGDINPHETVIHRPIGISGLGDDCWVSSMPHEVAQLLARREDPDRKDLEDKRYASLVQEAAVKGLVTVSAEGVVSYPSGKKRLAFLGPIRDGAKKEVKAAKAAVQTWKGIKDKNKPEPPPPAKSMNQYVLEALNAMENDATAKEELAFIGYLNNKANVEVARKKFPTTYTTKSGAAFDTDQRSIGWAKGKSRAQLSTEIAKIFGFLGHESVDKLGPFIKSALGL